MIAVMDENDRYEDTFDDAAEIGGMERFTHRRRGAFPVRSHAARSRARMRSRGGAAARQKARTINGACRRGKHKRVFATF